ncbi:MAG: hypothetical protein JSS50_02160 [Proteobacteria bacterium]|nr:hypothetical protein [Pseudomonadota bacterium]
MLPGNDKLKAQTLMTAALQFSASFGDFQRWVHAIVLREVELHDIHFKNGNEPTGFLKSLDEDLKELHADAIRAQPNDSIYLGNIAMSFTFLAGPTPEYLLHVVDTLSKENLLDLTQLPERMSQAMSEGFPKRVLSMVDERAIMVDQNLTALLAAYPNYMRHSTLNMTYAPETVVRCQTLFKQNDIKVSVDEGELKKQAEAVDRSYNTVRTTVKRECIQMIEKIAADSPKENGKILIG